MIYVIGDSFSFGDEVRDDAVIPNFPGFTQLQGREQATWQAHRKKYLEKTYGWKKYAAECNEIAWPSVLSGIVGEKVVNGSVSGASMMHLMAKIQIDLTSLTNSGEKITGVYVMVTSHNRSGVFRDVDGTVKIRDVSPFFSNQSKASEDYVSAWLGMEDDFDMSCRWMFFLKGMIDTSRSITGITPVILDSVFTSLPSIQNLHTFEMTGYNEPLRDSIVEFLPDTLDTMKHHIVDDRVMPLGHYCELTHRAFATHIANRYHK